MKFHCIKNQLAMTYKMAASDLLYSQGSLSYGDSKSVRLKTLMKKIVFSNFKAWFMANRFLNEQQELMVSKMVF